FQHFLEAAGIQVCSLVSHDIATAALAGELSEEGVLDLAKSNDALQAEVVLLPDTAMHTARLIVELERALAKPVLTANQVTVWKGLELAGRHARNPELGTLFRGGRRRLTCSSPTPSSSPRIPPAPSPIPPPCWAAASSASTRIARVCGPGAPSGRKGR